MKKKATIKPVSAEVILRSHGISKKRAREILARYAAAKKKLQSKASSRKTVAHEGEAASA